MPNNGPPALSAWAFEGFCRLFLDRFCGMQVTRAAPLPDRPFLICSNHLSHADSAALMLAAQIPFRDCGLLAAKDYFFSQPRRLRVVSSVLRLVAVDRHMNASGYRAVVENCESLLQADIRALIIYPEGGRRRPDQPVPFKRLAALLALTLDLPVVPCFVSGTESVLPRNRALPRRAPVAVRLGAPILPAAVLPGGALRDRSIDLTHMLEEQVRALAANGP